MPIVLRWFLWFLCWVGVVYIGATSKKVYAVPEKTRKAVSAILCVLFFVVFNSTAMSQWMEEKASARKGHIDADYGWHMHPQFSDSDVKFRIGPHVSDKDLILNWGGPKDQMEFNFQDISKVSVKRVNGRLLLNVDIRNRDGNRLVTIDDNDWTIWDSRAEINYTSNSLEVKDETGHVVFKAALFPDLAQFEGEWWNEDKQGIRALRPYPWDAEKPGPEFILLSPASHPDTPSIHPMFKYPSYLHFGELSESRRHWFDKIFALKIIGLG
jgi:hypothetical protein